MEPAKEYKRTLHFLQGAIRAAKTNAGKAERQAAALGLPLAPGDLGGVQSVLEDLDDGMDQLIEEAALEVREGT